MRTPHPPGTPAPSRSPYPTAHEFRAAIREAWQKTHDLFHELEEHGYHPISAHLNEQNPFELRVAVCIPEEEFLRDAFLEVYESLTAWEQSRSDARVLISFHFIGDNGAVDADALREQGFLREYATAHRWVVRTNPPSVRQPSFPPYVGRSDDATTPPSPYPTDSQYRTAIRVAWQKTRQLFLELEQEGLHPIIAYLNDWGPCDLRVMVLIPREESECEAYERVRSRVYDWEAGRVAEPVMIMIHFTRISGEVNDAAIFNDGFQRVFSRTRPWETHTTRQRAMNSWRFFSPSWEDGPIGW